MIKDMFLIYKKPIEVKIGSSNDIITDNLTEGELITKLDFDDYDSLKKEYGKYDQERDEYILKDGDYEGFELGILDYDGTTSYRYVFNEDLANESIANDIVENILDNELTIFLDYENLEIEKCKAMIDDEEMSQKLFNLINDEFTNLRSKRRYLLKIEGVYEKENPNILKWELSRIAKLDFKNNTWTNWNKVSYSGFINYENDQFIMIKKDEEQE